VEHQGRGGHAGDQHGDERPGEGIVLLAPVQAYADADHERRHQQGRGEINVQQPRRPRLIPQNVARIIALGIGNCNSTYTVIFYAGCQKIMPRRMSPDRRISLSRRELECLYWSALGKTSWETAIILGLSERTINF